MIYYFIVNPGSRSGHGKAVWQTVERILEREQVEYHVFFTDYRYHATELAREITSRKEKLTLVALGGDGTIDEVINGIQDFARVTFAYIPTGSSNDFARSLNLPTDTEEAVLNILHPKYLQKIDLGLALMDGEEHRFAVSCGCGFDAAVCHEALASRFKNLLNKLKLGKLTYVGIALKQIIMSKYFASTLILDDHKTLRYKKTFFIAGMNCRYEGGGLLLTPNAKPNDGLIDICVVEGLPRLVIATMLPTAYIGKHTIFPGIHLFRAKKFELKFGEQVTFHTDGEPFYVQRNITVSCLPKCLTMVVGK